MNVLKDLLLSKGVLQVSRATEIHSSSNKQTDLTLQTSHRMLYLRESEEVMTKYPGNKQPEQNSRKLVFHNQFKKDLKYWKKKDPQQLKCIKALIEEIQHNPFEGSANPKHLKYKGPDAWSRRINNEHRIVYLVSDDQIDFIQARFHYSK